MKLEVAKEQNTATQEKLLQSKMILPELPMFEDSRDKMDAYIERFERFATIQKWDKGS